MNCTLTVIERRCHETLRIAKRTEILSRTARIYVDRLPLTAPKPAIRPRIGPRDRPSHVGLRLASLNGGQHGVRHNRPRRAMPPAQELTVSRPSLPALTLPGIAVRHRVALAVLGLTALTFLAPAAPTYDPWAWIIWGREIVHLDLSTVDGPSWKPLPVLLTTPFSLFGGLAPDLWVFVARAGAIAGIVMLFRLGRRLGGVPAGVAAAVPYALAPWTIRNAAMANSELLPRGFCARCAARSTSPEPHHSGSSHSAGSTAKPATTRVRTDGSRRRSQSP